MKKKKVGGTQFNIPCIPNTTFSLPLPNSNISSLKVWFSSPLRWLIYTLALYSLLKSSRSQPFPKSSQSTYWSCWKMSCWMRRHSILRSRATPPSGRHLGSVILGTRGSLEFSITSYCWLNWQVLPCWPQCVGIIIIGLALNPTSAVDQLEPWQDGLTSLHLPPLSTVVGFVFIYFFQGWGWNLGLAHARQVKITFSRVSQTWVTPSLW